MNSKVRYLMGAAITAAALTASGATAVGTSAQAAPKVHTKHCGAGGASARHAGDHTRESGGVDAPSAAVRKAVQATLHSRAGRQATRELGQSTITVNVSAHVIRASSYKKGEKAATDAQVKSQISHLNKAYSGKEKTGSGAANTQFRFHLSSLTHNTNNSWFRNSSQSNGNPNYPVANKMKRTLHRGGKSTLNLYFVNFQGGLLGFATFPMDYASNPDIDGVVMDARTVPGGSYNHYNQGDTATHEIGHWFGLYHVFFDSPSTQNCATDDNDFVTDTPVQATPSFECPTGKDSCPVQSGVDNIHNYMDYSYDSCMYLFTSGQSDRMSAMWANYR